MAVVTAVLTIFLCLLISAPLLKTLYLNFFTSRSALNGIPGPFWARYTNIWRLCMVWRGRAEREVLDLHRRYGKVVRLGPNCVSMGDVSLIKRIYTTKGVWKKGDMYKGADFVQGGKTHTTLFSTRDEAAHSAMFRPIARLYTMSNVVSHENLVDSTLLRFMNQLDNRFVEHNKPCEFDKWLHYFAWDVIGEVTFSESFGFLEQGADCMDLIKTNDKTMDYIGTMMSMPILDSFLDKNPVARIGPPSATAAGNFAAQRLFKRLGEAKSVEQWKQKDFLGSFVALKGEYPDIEDGLLISYLMMNIIAGSDTTAIGLRSVFYYVLKDKSVYLTLQQELDAAQSESPVRWKTVQTMPYLEAVIREACRIHPAVGFALERVVPEGGLSLPDGKYLPPGVEIGMNPWVTARDEMVYGKEVDKFIPERWLQRSDESQDAFEARLSAMKTADLSFGFGKRACYGKPLATLEMYKVIATLFSAYHITLAYPDKEWTTKNNFFVSQKGLEVKLSKRISSRA